MKPIVIIPARLKAVRLPNKPLLNIEGETMIRRTAKQVLAGGVSPVAVAADHQAILDDVADLEGVIPVMTGEQHTCGTERVLEAYQILSKEYGDFDIIINVQGDEPFMDPKMISALLEELEKRKDLAEFWTTVSELPEAELADQNVAKVVLDLKQNALIFTRDAISESYKHTSIYIYTPAFLERFCQLPHSPLEDAYRLEQMRALDHGEILNCIPLPYDAISINDEADLAKAGVTDYQIAEID